MPVLCRVSSCVRERTGLPRTSPYARIALHNQSSPSEIDIFFHYPACGINGGESFLAAAQEAGSRCELLRR